LGKNWQRSWSSEKEMRVHGSGLPVHETKIIVNIVGEKASAWEQKKKMFPKATIAYNDGLSVPNICWLVLQRWYYFSTWRCMLNGVWQIEDFRWHISILSCLMTQE
jgi:hypothetical protein